MSTAKPRCCSICRQPGHTKRKCPQAQTTKAAPAVPIPIETTDCPICMEPVGKTNCCTTQCGHQFCLKCFVTHTKTKSNCPLCRADIPGANAAPPPARDAIPLRQHHSQTIRIRWPQSRFDIYIQNHSNITLNVWWIPVGLRDPIVIQSNITPGTVRRVNVGSRGDRFSLLPPTINWFPQTRLVDFQANVPGMNFVYTGSELIELD